MRTVPHPCTRHRRPDARNEIAGTCPRRQPEGRTVFGLSFLPPPELAFPLTDTHPDANRRQAQPKGKSSARRSSRRARGPLTQPRSPCRDSTYGTPLPCTKALRRPLAQNRAPRVKSPHAALPCPSQDQFDTRAPPNGAAERKPPEPSAKHSGPTHAARQHRMRVPGSGLHKCSSENELHPAASDETEAEYATYFCTGKKKR